ncbi:type I-E CRISPR-associated protein Cse1/CasA [Nocardioides houyundeii]|uniref:type I-E CRISPR-associated protein Cse1/CasA n=1 Tax=Nocardioides houyundeii TaxID=2045452 RepID=UPI00131548C4|nr:type I-E CRISPR-associated protein Cse1/CasA [Nocardioides houyundeii]
MNQTAVEDGVFNALHDPWIPVTLPGGRQAIASPCDILVGADDYVGLGSGMSPLERDATTRLLISLTGLALRLGDVEAGDLADIPAAGVKTLTDTFSDHFWLRHHSRPFCQEWELAQDDTNKAIRSLAFLDPQTPGSSSSQWGTTAGSTESKAASIAADPARLTRLVVTTWWHTKHSNARDGYGRKFEYGAPGDVAVRTLGAYMTHRDSLAKTLMANVPEQWLDSGSLPAYLDQDGGPSDEELAREPLDLWRTTCARNTPLLHWDDTQNVPVPTGYVLGPSTKRVPMIAPTEGESLKAMHSQDPSRLFVETKQKGGTVLAKPVSAPDVRLSSTEGYMRWYLNDLAGSLKVWRDRVRPFLPIDDSEAWMIGAFAEICDTQGNRKWLDYAFVPRRRLEAPAVMDDGRHGPVRLLEVASEFRKALNGPLRIASEGRGRAEGAPALRAQTERALLAALEEDIASSLDARATDSFDAQAVAGRMRKAALVVFDAATEPFATPIGLPNVVTARSRYRFATQNALARLFEAESTTKTKEGRA